MILARAENTHRPIGALMPVTGTVTGMTRADEEYADTFAYALLMPEAVVIQRVRDGYSLERLALEFGVETSRMRSRLDQLGLWDREKSEPRWMPRRWEWATRRFQRIS
jgi:Zn-dependent peptidase ImmA (M78 family)